MAQGVEIDAVVISLNSLATVFVALRVVSRFSILERPAADDYFIIAAPSASVFSCLPIAFFSDKSIEGGKCISLLPFWYFVAFFNIVTDIAVVGLPIFVLKDLRSPRRQKVAVMGIFAVGGVTCIIAMIRLDSILVLTKSKDVSYDNAKAAMWSAAELNIAILCAYLPSLKPLMQKVTPRWLGKEDSRRGTDDLHTSTTERIQPVLKLKGDSLGSSYDSSTSKSCGVDCIRENLQRENF